MKMKAKRFLCLMLCILSTLTLPPMTALAASREPLAQTGSPVFSDLVETDALYPYAVTLRVRESWKAFPTGLSVPRRR